MQIAAKAASIARTRAHDDAAYHFAGLLIVALFPALFWTTLIAGIGSAIGQMPSALALMTFGLAIAGFCGAVCNALFSRA
jgi:hypothetical protein